MERGLQTENLFQWRERFHSFCHSRSLSPTHLCIQFSSLFPFVDAIALNAGSVREVQESIAYAEEAVPMEIWRDLQRLGLLHPTLQLDLEDSGDR